MRFVLHIRGGLGNQLFQYATMRYLQSLRPGADMCIDKSGYRNYTIRDFELTQFRLIENVREYHGYNFFYLFSRKCYHLYQYVYHRFTGYYAPMLGALYQRLGLFYSTIDYVVPINFSKTDNYLYGYFASFNYIDTIRDVIIKEVELKESLKEEAKRYIDNIKRAENPVGVSVRYGNDYQNLGWPICQKEYYISGMKKIQEKRGHCKFFIFSDVIDIIIKERWFDGYDVEYISGLSVPESFTLLKSCSDFVIPNSSFSVWAAYLCENPNKIVYAPNYFYTEKYKHKYDRLIHFKGELFLDYRTGEETDDI